MKLIFTSRERSLPENHHQHTHLYGGKWFTFSEMFEDFRDFSNDCFSCDFLPAFPWHTPLRVWGRNFKHSPNRTTRWHVYSKVFFVCLPSSTDHSPQCVMKFVKFLTARSIQSKPLRCKIYPCMHLTANTSKMAAQLQPARSQTGVAPAAGHVANQLPCVRARTPGAHTWITKCTEKNEVRFNHSNMAPAPKAITKLTWIVLLPSLKLTDRGPRYVDPQKNVLLLPPHSRPGTPTRNQPGDFQDLATQRSDGDWSGFVLRENYGNEFSPQRLWERVPVLRSFLLRFSFWASVRERFPDGEWQGCRVDRGD